MPREALAAIMMYMQASGRNFIIRRIYPEFTLVKDLMLRENVSACVLGAALDDEGEVYLAKSVGSIVLKDPVLRAINTRWRDLAQEFPRTCDTQ